jgi:hypothetical protein
MVCFGVLNVLVVWQLRDRIFRGYGDFAAFYTAGVIVQRGQTVRLYDRTLQWQIQQEFSSAVDQRKGPLPFIRPPFEALLFAPLARFAYPIAFAIWSAAKLIALIAMPFLISSQARPSLGVLSPAIGGLISLAYFPVAFDFLQGQDAILLLLLLLFAFSAYQRGADFQTGALLSLGLFKFHLVLPMFLILAWRRGRVLGAGFLAGALTLLLVSAFLVGWSNLARYPTYLLELSLKPGIAGFYASIMPNFRGLMALFYGNSALPWWVQLLLATLALAAVILAVRLRPTGIENRGDALIFSFSIVVSVVTSLYGNLGDLALILLPILLLGGEYVQSQRWPDWPRKVFLVCVAVLLVSPIFWLDIFLYRSFYWIVLVLGTMAFSLWFLASAQIVADLQSPSTRFRLAKHYKES